MTKKIFTQLGKLMTGFVIALSLFGLVAAPVTSYAAVPAPTTSTTGQCQGSSCALLPGANSFSGASGIVGLLLTIANFVIFIVGAVAVLFLVYGGFLYIFNPGGDETNVKKGQTIIFNAIVGLIVALVAYTIVTLISNLVQGSITDTTGTQTS